MVYARFEKPVIDANNALQSGVWCEVRREGVANNPLEPLFADRMGDTPLSNPFYTAGSSVAFHAAGGAFQVRLYKTGYDETFRYVPVGLGAENDLQGFVPMGAWDNLTTYAIGDVVTRNNGGTLYLFASKVNDNLAQTPNAVGPADSAYWAYIGVAVQGPAGASGVIGTWRGPWVTLTAYALHDAVQYAGSSYICISSHTAGTFATDLAASKWQLTTAKGDHGDVESLTAGTGITVDSTDPAHPIIAVATVSAGTMQMRVAGSGTGAPIAGTPAQGRALLGANRLLKSFTPQDNQPPASNFATLDTRNSRAVLDFDTTTQEAAVFTFCMPADYNGAGLTVVIEASLTSATSGTLGWDAAFETTASLDIDGDSFATAKTGTAATVPGTSGVTMKHTISFSNSEIDGLAAGDTGRLRIRRDVANDTAAGDAELVSVRLETA